AHRFVHRVLRLEVEPLHEDENHPQPDAERGVDVVKHHRESKLDTSKQLDVVQHGTSPQLRASARTLVATQTKLVPDQPCLQARMAIRPIAQRTNSAPHTRRSAILPVQLESRS